MIIRPVATLVAVVVLSAVAVVGAPGAPDQGAGPPIVGGTAAQRELLRHVFRAMGGTQITRVKISASDGGVRLVMPPGRFHRLPHNVSVRLEWDAHLVTYSFLRLSLERKLRPVLGFSVAGLRHSFRSLEPRSLLRFDRSEIVRPVGRAVKRSGARLVEFNLFRPAAPAFAVVVASDRPARFIERRLGPIIHALNRTTAFVDGFYVAVTDERRSVVFAYSDVQERGTSAASLYVRLDLLGCAEYLPVDIEVAPEGAPPCPRD